MDHYTDPLNFKLLLSANPLSCAKVESDPLIIRSNLTVKIIKSDFNTPMVKVNIDFSNYVIVHASAPP